MLSVHAVHPCNQSIARALVCMDIKYYTSVLEIPSHDDFSSRLFRYTFTLKFLPATLEVGSEFLHPLT